MLWSWDVLQSELCHRLGMMQWLCDALSSAPYYVPDALQRGPGKAPSLLPGHVFLTPHPFLRTPGVFIVTLPYDLA